MPRGRKKKETTEVVVETTPETVSETAVAVAEPPAAAVIETPATITTAATPNENPPPFEPTGSYEPSEAERNGAETTPRPQFRTWVVDTARGYTRMTDEEHHRIVLQFAERPPADMLTAVKGAGFFFQPDYCGQKNVWVRRNDFVGRTSVESLEKLLHQLLPGPESPAR